MLQSIKRLGIVKKLSFMVRYGYPWMILWGIIVHSVWGYSLIQHDRTASLVILVGLNKIIELGASPEVLGCGLIFAAVTAAFGLVFEPKLKAWQTLTLIGPQYFLMMWAFGSDIEILVEGMNSSTGAPVERWIILVVLAPMLTACLLHTMAILERFIFYPRSRIYKQRANAAYTLKEVLDAVKEGREEVNGVPVSVIINKTIDSLMAPVI